MGPSMVMLPDVPLPRLTVSLSNKLCQTHTGTVRGVSLQYCSKKDYHEVCKRAKFLALTKL